MEIWKDMLARVGIGRRRRDRRMLQGLLNGYRNTALLYVAARLGLLDLLADGPRSSAELAAAVGAHAPSLHRLLRALVVLGVCRERRDGRFSATPMGQLLQARARRSLRGVAILFGEEYYATWGGLLHSVMTGEPAFERVFGMGQWEHRAKHPELNEFFNAGIERGTERAVRAIVSAYDFSRFGTIADIGGGHGVLLAAILKAHPAARGILFERQQVVEAARSYLEAAGVGARCQLVAGSFFESLPAGADVCILKSVIHDWDDERCLAILKGCRRALNGRGTLLLVERMAPDRADQAEGTVMMDVQMLVVTGGRERTAEEHRALLAAAGFRLTRVIPTRGRHSIIEAVPVGDAGGP